jgi:hypothetical protein
LEEVALDHGFEIDTMEGNTVTHNEKAKKNQERWKVVITDCDQGSVEIEKEEMDRIGAR